jgi:hypothetical protein
MRHNHPTLQYSACRLLECRQSHKMVHRDVSINVYESFRFTKIQNSAGQTKTEEMVTQHWNSMYFKIFCCYM